MPGRYLSYLVCAAPLLDDTKFEMCYTRRFDNSGAFQFDCHAPGVREQTLSFSEQFGHQMNLYLVNEASVQELLCNIRAAAYRNGFFACGSFCLLEGAFNTVGDEGKRCCSLSDIFRNLMGGVPSLRCPGYCSKLSP